MNGLLDPIVANKRYFTTGSVDCRDVCCQFKSPNIDTASRSCNDGGRFHHSPANLSLNWVEGNTRGKLESNRKVQTAFDLRKPEGFVCWNDFRKLFEIPGTG